MLICNYIRFPLYIARSITNIYHKDETSEYSVFLFFYGMLKSSSAGGYLGVPLRVGLSAASPRYAVGFSLQSLTWVKGISLSCVDTLAHGTKFIIGISLARPLLSRMNGNSYFTFAVISSIRFVIFLMEYFSINLLFAASVFNFSLINFSWGRSDWQHSFKFSISVP